MSNSSALVPVQQKKANPKSAAIDNMHEIVDPINYGFFKMDNIEEIKDEEPRPSPRKSKQESETKPGKSKTKALRLNNNSLNQLDTLVTAVEAVVEQPKDIGWFDFSFNELQDIPDTILEYENIRILYLHGNQISDINQVKKLSKLKHLRKLTLHGNPIDKQKDYRSTVLSFLPNLQQLDFSGVSKAEIRTSQTLSNFKKNKTTKKKDLDDED